MATIATPGSFMPGLATRFFQKEIVTQTEPQDPRVWVPQGPGVYFRPLLLDTVTGVVANILKIERGGVYGRHVHNAPVLGYVIAGSWRYVEHDWVARAGDFVYEPPGEVHTLVVDGEHDVMKTYFVVHGGLTTCDEEGRPSKIENVFTKIDLCDQHYRACGLGPHYIEQFVR